MVDWWFDLFVASVPLVLIFAITLWMVQAFDSLMPSHDIYIKNLVMEPEVKRSVVCKNCKTNKALNDGFGLCQMCKENPKWWMVG